MFHVTGNFSEDGTSYTLNTPKTRTGYCSCLLNQRGYAFGINQYGMGQTLCRVSFTEQNNILSNGERTIYFRDDDTNDIWCIGGFPYASSVTHYHCTHHQSHTVIESEHNGIKVSITYFVPFDRLCDIQSVTIENMTTQTRHISIFPAAKLQLTGYEAPEFCNTLEQSYKTDFYKEINGLYLDGRNPYVTEKPYHAFLTSTTPVFSYTGDSRDVFGFQISLSHPYSIIDGEDLIPKPGLADKMFFLLQTKTTLNPRESFHTDYILGICKNYDHAKEELAQLKTSDDVVKSLKETQEFNLQRRNRLLIETPDNQTNTLINYWLKMGLEWNLLWRRAPRDNMQFSSAALMYDPKVSRFTIRHVMETQFRDGHFLRRWIPAVVKTEYADKPMWVILGTCEYLKFTGDFDFLNEEVPYYDGESGTVWEHLILGLRRTDQQRGPHRLPLSHFADWNDALNTGDRDPNAESVFVAMQFVLALREMSELCKKLGKKDLEDEFSQKSQELKDIINQIAWDKEGYYIRSFADQKPVGASSCQEGSVIYMNPQSWSVIADVCPKERLQSLLDSVDKYLDTPVGCLVNYPAYTKYNPYLGRISFQYPGTSENGAVYAHATAFKMYADCLLGLGDRAYESYQKLMPENPKNPSESPDGLPYTLSNACITAKECFGRMSSVSWTTGTIAWVFRTVIEGFFGIHYAYGGFKIKPAFPSQWDKASLTLHRNGTIYRFSIENKNTGKKKIYVDNNLLDGDFMAFSEKETVNVLIQL